MVYGRREWALPDPLPFWFRKPGPMPYAEGQPIRHAATHNVLMAGELAGMRLEGRSAGLRFDERLAHGEDTEFFWRAQSEWGANIVYGAKAVVVETIPPHRATLRYQLTRTFYQATNRTFFHCKHHGFNLALARVLVRLVWQVPVALVRLTTAPLLWPFSAKAFKRAVQKGLRRLAGAAGAFLGIAGFNGNPYRNVGRVRRPARGAVEALRQRRMTERYGTG
jgi:hypothetical protein